MPRILVVDDEKRLRDLYREELKRHGYEVVCASSGPEAVDAVRQGDMDVVLLDVAMPGMDGIEALQRILRVDDQLPVILHTSYGSYKGDFTTWAAEDYITKPADLGELVQTIERALEKRKASYNSS